MAAVDKGLWSRKFIITMTGMVIAGVLAYMSKMDANVGLVIGAAIGAYNWANLRESQNGNAPQ